MDYQGIARVYEREFSTEYFMVRAPGRVNLIGEHTDYNQGFVFPAAVDKEIAFAIGKSGSDACTLVALDLQERFEFMLSEVHPLPANSWQNYILGVVAEIRKSKRKLEGFNLVFSGNVPRGSGMSSSAALECGTCFGLNELFDLGIPKMEMVHMSQRAEHTYTQVKCGIMDQYISVMGKNGYALILDCKSLEHTSVPVNLGAYQLFLLNSNVSHSLATSEYNNRREQCEEGVDVLNEKFAEIQSLRDTNLEQLTQARSLLSDVVYRRCKYVLEENQRVLGFAEALQNGDLKRCGILLNEAQKGMREDYEITCPEIDFMIAGALENPDVLGVRMMGGGFGGCTLNLIKKGTERQFVESLNASYNQRFGLNITPIAISLAEGVGLVRKP